MTHPEDRGAYILTQKSQTVLKSTFKNPPRQMPLKLLIYHFGVGVLKNNFIFNLTDDAMSRLIQNGVPQHLLSFLKNDVMRPMAPDEAEPKVFELEDLNFGFYVFLVCCASSIFVFVVEVIVFSVMEIVGLILLLRALASAKNFPGGIIKDSIVNEPDTTRAEENSLRVRKSFFNL